MELEQCLFLYESIRSREISRDKYFRSENDSLRHKKQVTIMNFIFKNIRNDYLNVYNYVLIRMRLLKSSYL